MLVSLDVLVANGASEAASAQVDDRLLADEIRQYEPTAGNIRLAVKRMGGEVSVAATLRNLMHIEESSRLKSGIDVVNGEKAMRVTTYSTDAEGAGWIHDMPVSDAAPRNLPESLRVTLGKMTFLSPEDYQEVSTSFFTES